MPRSELQLTRPGKHSGEDHDFAIDRGCRCALLSAARRAGVAGKVSPHWMRHAYASHALDRGAPIHVLKETLGHSSIAVTSAYVHARPTESSSLYLAV